MIQKPVSVKCANKHENSILRRNEDRQKDNTMDKCSKKADGCNKEHKVEKIEMRRTGRNKTDRWRTKRLVEWRSKY